MTRKIPFSTVDRSLAESYLDSAIRFKADDATRKFKAVFPTIVPDAHFPTSDLSALAAL